MITLRPYQTQIINELRLKLAEGKKRLVMCAPTGAGKTIMFTYMVSEHLKRGGRAIVFTHRKELLKQSGSSFEKFNLKPEFINAGSKPDLSQPLHVAMIETFYRRIADLDFFILQKTLIIIDECHINNFTKIFQSINKSTIVIGATATPYRKGNDVDSMADYYQELIQPIDTADLIKLKFLSRAESYGVKINTKGLKVKGDDLDTEKYYKEKKMYQGVINNWIRLTPNKKTLLFASNVKSSKDVCAEFCDRGFLASHIDAKTPKKEREQILSWFENTDNAILCNCGILTAGYDCPEIETIILYRATTSLPLFLQMCGRGSRITPEKNKFTILDFGNNILRLGFWEDRRTWSLEKDNKKVNDKLDAAFIKLCKKCGAILPPSTATCPYCGAEIIKEEEEIIAELSLLTAREKWSKNLETKAIMCKNKLMNGFAVLHSLKDIDEARYFCKLMGYSPYFEHVNKHRFKVFQQ